MTGSVRTSADLVAALQSDQVVVEAVLQRLWHEIPTYEVVDRDAVVASVERIRRRACETLRRRLVPPIEEYWEAERTTMDRLRVGVPIEDIMAGFRITIASIQRRLVELAASLAIEGEEVVELTSLLWKLSDAFSLRGSAAYHRQGMAIALADQRRRDEWIARVLAGDLDPHQTIRGCTVYGVSPGAPYYALTSRPDIPEAIERLQQRIGTHRPGRAWTFISQDRLVGIVETPPTPMPGILLAIGPARPVDELAESFRIAQQVLASAELEHSDGLHTCQTLGWRLAAPTHGPVRDVLSERYLAPLVSAGRFGDEVVDSLRSYLRHQRSIPRTAAAMHVHVNTLRYRLQRFEELTGRCLEDTDTLVELSLVLYGEPAS